MNIKESDLITLVNAYLAKQRDDELKLKTEMKRQEVIQFVSSQLIDDYVSKNIESSEQGTFRRALIDTLIANDFYLWDNYKRLAN